MSNFVSSNNANALFDAVGKKKLTVTDVMPLTASAANEGIPYLYLGATTQDYTNGSIYKCQEVTPATDPKTYEFVEIYQSNVDLSKYKRIWGGTEAAWEQLTDEEKAQYDYEFFEGDTNDYFAVVDAVTEGDMHPVTSNAVYESLNAHNLGTAIDLWNYTSTEYTTPSDGYVNAASGSTVNSRTNTYINGVLLAVTRCPSTNYSISSSIFVKKGMTLRHDSSDASDGAFRFYPIIS